MYRLQNTVSLIIEEIKRRDKMLGSEPKKSYSLLLKVLLHALGTAHFPEIENNVLFSSLTNAVYKLVSDINFVIQHKFAEASLYIKDSMMMLERRKNFERPLYVILCDALSITEYMFMIHMFRRLVQVEETFCAINPSGKTKTFEYLANEYLNIEPVPCSEELTMRKIGDGLRLKLGAYGYTIFRDFDRLVHWGGEYRDLDEMINSLFKVSMNLCRITEKWLANRYDVLVMADHGYDIIKEGDSWKLVHRWVKGELCVSPFVPLLVLARK